MDETLTQMRTMTSAAELNSEKAAPEENGGPNPDREAAAASSAGPEAAPAVEAAAAPGEEPRVSDVGEAKAKVAQPVEPEGESSAVEAAGDGEAGVARSVIVPSRTAVESPLGDALAALDRRDYATAKRLFEALGRKDAAVAIENALAALDRKDYATAQGLFEALKPSMPAAPAGIPMRSDARGEAELKPVPPPLAVVPNDGPRQPPAETVKRRGSRLGLLAVCIALLAIVGAGVLYRSQRHGAFVAAKSQTAAGLASAADSTAAPAKANADPTGRGEAAVATGDPSASLATVTERLDRIERETGARLDALGERSDPTALAKLSDLSARLTALEKKAVAPATPASDTADIAARLDRLEKKVAAAATPPSQLSDLTTRLDRLEKKVATSVASAASAAKPLPPAAPKSSTTQARTQPDAPRRLLQDYSVEAVQGGVAVVDGRYGSQQVGPGDFIPGAGRVLRIERQGGDWYVLTSGGVIAGASALYGAPY
jgi:tetrahydromethanopterin S-methyltransferase subunit G